MAVLMEKKSGEKKHLKYISPGMILEVSYLKWELVRRKIHCQADLV